MELANHERKGVKASVRRARKGEKGQTATEYLMIMALTMITIVTAMQNFGNTVKGSASDIASDALGGQSFGTLGGG